jgi:hypothetical protein
LQKDSYTVTLCGLAGDYFPLSRKGVKKRYQGVVRRMQQGFAVSEGDLNIVPSKTSSHSDFDFFLGKWAIHNRRLKERLKGSNEWEEFEAVGECHAILNGFGNTDTFNLITSEGEYEGMTLRLFNPKTRLWSIYWANSKTVTLDVPQVGSFENNVGLFYAGDVWEGTPVVVLYKWDADPVNPAWSQAVSADNGKTWEWNWYMNMTRVA